MKEINHNLADLEIAKDMLASIEGGLTEVVVDDPTKKKCDVRVCAIPLYGVVIDRFFA